MLALATGAVSADNYEGYRSEIPGIGLLWLQPGEEQVLRFRFGEAPEFATYCNGRNELSVHELERAFVCETMYWNEFRGWQADQVWQRREVADAAQLEAVIAAARQDPYSNAGQSEYFVRLHGLKVEREGIHTLSKMRLTHGSWQVEVPDRSLLTAATEVAQTHAVDFPRDPSMTYESAIGTTDASVHERMFRVHTDERYTLALHGGGCTVVLVPTWFEMHELGGDLISSVIVREGDRDRFVGHVRGCLLRVGADLDVDGMPELILENCSNSEGQSIDYLQVLPVIRKRITYQHN